MYSLSRLCQHGVKYVKVLNTKIGARYAITLSLSTTRPIIRSIMSINAQTRYFAYDAKYSSLLNNRPKSNTIQTNPVQSEKLNFAIQQIRDMEKNNINV